jgi:spore maturation protein CgeB
MRVVILGLSVTSSWGNGHATNYRALLRALASAGHQTLFLERDMPWYAAHRDLPRPPYGETELYHSLAELHRFSEPIATSDLVMVGSYVPDGVEVARLVTESARGVTAFYDIDTPVTLAALERGDCEYLDAKIVGEYDLYLSFTAGPTLAALERLHGVRRAAPFHCFADPEAYAPLSVPRRWDLGYLGTYSSDRQGAVQELLIEVARRRPSLRCVVAGPQYPASIDWPSNVDRVDHLPPSEHAAFYRSQRLTLNVTRAAMREAGWSPSVRLFEAGATATPVVSDPWPGLDDFFTAGREIFIAESAADVLAILDRRSDAELAEVGLAARARVLAEHTADRRVEQLEALVREVRSQTTAENNEAEEQ